jgi:hypothetical protein
MEPGKLDPAGLEKFDQFLAIAEEQGIYVHPTGPDHWEGLPEWARTDRIADERVLAALEEFWKLFAARYRGRDVIFAYDLLNEPETQWDTPVMQTKWRVWIEKRYGTLVRAAKAWGLSPEAPELAKPPSPQNDPGNRRLLDYQLFREDLAEEWTRRQVLALRKADPDALVTVGLIQWSVPSLLPGLRHYSGFRPARHAGYLDFMEVHFYPFDPRPYDYAETEEASNLAYLHGVVGEVARFGKPVVLAEFGWYGGGKPRFNEGKQRFASQEEQARWCREAVLTTAGQAHGWLNWGLYDQPEATDPSEFSGLLTVEGDTKAWGREFQRLSGQLPPSPTPGTVGGVWPSLPWADALTSTEAGHAFRRQYFQVFTNRVSLKR